MPCRLVHAFAFLCCGLWTDSYIPVFVKHPRARLRGGAKCAPYGYQSVLSTFSTPSRQASWVFFAVACFASLVSLSLMADAAESLNQAGTAQSRERFLGLFALGAAARLDIKHCDVQGVRPSISSTRTCCRGRFSPPWLQTRRPSLR